MGLIKIEFNSKLNAFEVYNLFKDEKDTILLDSSKETIISSIKASKDSPAGIINTYYAKKLVNSLSFEERIENISKITKNDIINLSTKISMHTVYLLEGEENEDN